MQNQNRNNNQFQNQPYFADSPASPGGSMPPTPNGPQKNTIKMLIVIVSSLCVLTAALLMLFLLLFLSRDRSVEYDDTMLEVETVDVDIPAETVEPSEIVQTTVVPAETQAPVSQSIKVSVVTSVVKIQQPLRTVKPTTPKKKSTTTTVTTKKKAETTATTKFKSYLIEVNDYLPIYKEPGYDSAIAQYFTTINTKYTIVAEYSFSSDSRDKWGKLKSGVGWVNLYDCANSVYTETTDPPAATESNDSNIDSCIDGLPYLYADLNSDGNKELLVLHGEYEANYVWYVYTIVNNNAVYFDEIGATHKSLCLCSSGNVYLYHCWMGSVGLYRLEMGGSAFSSTDVYPVIEDTDGTYMAEIDAFLESEGNYSYSLNY
ncbi:MAG: hypothetical protein ACI4JN_07830 [Ruminococcus sp.]